MAYLNKKIEKNIYLDYLMTKPTTFTLLGDPDTNNFSRLIELQAQQTIDLFYKPIKQYKK